MKRKQIRRSQTISPFGVGAILDIEGESFVMADIFRWRDSGEEIREPRLEAKLGVTRFKMAPEKPDNDRHVNEWTPGVPVSRFPNWMFCPKCRSMYYWYWRNEPICDSGHRPVKLVPMRFVMACPNGHLADVPWGLWAHSYKKNQCKEQRLEFRTLQGGSGLEYLEVRCRACGASRNLLGISSKDSLKQLGIKCPGKQPWQPRNEEESCDAIPQVVQRGATNLTFAQLTSAIDIPPNSDYDPYGSDTLAVTSHQAFGAVRSFYEANNPDVVLPLLNSIADACGLSLEVVKRIAEQETGKIEPPISAQPSDDEGDDGLLREEYEAFLAPDRDHDPRDRFIKRFVKWPATDLQKLGGIIADHFDQVVQVTRLREVRVLRGFSRLSPPTYNPDEGELSGAFSTYSGKPVDPRIVPSDLGKLPRTERWLPAIEVYGEGIFLTLNESRLREWESSQAVSQRLQVLSDRRNETARYLPLPTPRFVLLHTLAHVLIRQLSFECGYSISSLRERIYARTPGASDQPMAGILIYTAAGDSEGTLGGLVRQGEPDRLLPTILKAIQNAEWCSSDPLCRESTGQGFNALNLAACHACSLLPETSCIMSNRLLDRVLLIGSPDSEFPAYFSDLLR